MVEDALNVEIILTVISNASYYRSKWPRSQSG
jgi:hypothetical protein